MLLLLVLVALLAAGCAQAPPAPPGQVTLVGWGGPEEREIFSQALELFEEQNPDLSVRYVQVPGIGYDYVNKLRLMLVSGKAPDVFYVPDGSFGELVSRDVLLNLDAFVAESQVIKPDEMWTSGLDRYRWNGEQLHKGSLYCLPKDIGPRAMFYNKDVLRTRGVPFPDPERPMTWDEAVDVWKQLSFREDGVQHFGVSSFDYETAVWSNGGRILSEDARRWVLDSPEGIEAVQWVADLGLVHDVAPTYGRSGAGQTSSQLFESQLAAMHIDGRWQVPRFRTLDFAWDVAPIPVPASGMQPVTWSGSVGFGISSQTARAREAFRLIEFLAGPEGQRILTTTGLQVPNQKELAASEVYLQPGLAPEHPEVFLASIEASRPGPWTATPNVFWSDVFWNFYPRILRGQETAADYLPEIAPMINEILKEYN